MNYPVWDIPLIGSGWVIGIIAIFHVMISHFAVGGGQRLQHGGHLVAVREILVEGLGVFVLGSERVKQKGKTQKA